MLPEYIGGKRVLYWIFRASRTVNGVKEYGLKAFPIHIFE